MFCIIYQCTYTKSSWDPPNLNQNNDLSSSYLFIICFSFGTCIKCSYILMLHVFWQTLTKHYRYIHSKPRTLKISFTRESVTFNTHVPVHGIWQQNFTGTILFILQTFTNYQCFDYDIRYEAIMNKIKSHTLVLQENGSAGWYLQYCGYFSQPSGKGPPHYLVVGFSPLWLLPSSSCSQAHR